MFDSVYRLPDRLLQFCAADFEYRLVENRENLRFIGPILPVRPGGGEPPAWLKGLDGSRAVVLVTQGTLANSDFDQLVNPAITGLAGEDLLVIATAGGNDKAHIDRAANAIIEAYIPYELVLEKASVYLTNGGYNGVQQALSFGVPVISAGASEDKPYVSARVAWSGAGINLKTGNPVSEQIREAVREVIRNPSYRERAKTLGTSIRKTDALKTIAEVIEAEVS